MLCKKSSFWQLKQLTYTPRKKKYSWAVEAVDVSYPISPAIPSWLLKQLKLNKLVLKNRTIGQVKQLIIDKHAKNKRLWQFKQLTYTAGQKKLHLGSYNRNMEVKSVDLTGKCLWKARSCPRSVLNQFVFDKKLNHIALLEK